MMKSKSKTRINLEPTDRPTAQQICLHCKITMLFFWIDIQFPFIFFVDLGTHCYRFSGQIPAEFKRPKPVLKSGQKRQFDPLVGDLKKKPAEGNKIITAFLG